MSKRMIFAAFVIASMTAASAVDVPGYAVGDGHVLEVTISAGVTNDFDSSYAAALGQNAYAGLVKKGLGGLMMPDDISGFMGPITVSEGSLGYRKTYSLGSLADDAGVVTVEDGATLFVAADAAVDGPQLRGKRLVVSGMGVNGAGAVDVRSEQHRAPFGLNLTLAGDARIRNRTQYFWGYREGSREWRFSLDFGGHTLYLFSEGSTPSFSLVNMRNPGNVVVENRAFNSYDDCNWGGSSDNTLTIRASSGDIFKLPQPSPEWSLYYMTFKARSYIYGPNLNYDANFNAYPGVSTNLYPWKAPVTLERSGSSGEIQIYSQTKWHGGVTFLGKVSGSSNFMMRGNDPLDGDNFHHPYLNLVSSDNDFTGNLGLSFAGLRLWNVGALPLTTKVTMQAADVSFDDLRDDFGDLPALESDGSVYSRSGGTVNIARTNAVCFGRGKWASVTKTGGTRLEWYSGTGSALLDVREGLVKVGRRAKIAGLYSSLTNGYSSSAVDGFYYYDTDAWTLKLDLEAGVRAPNDLNHAYHNYSYKIDPTRETGDSQYAVMSYNGYIWNNSSSDVKWSFAGGGGARYRLLINDEEVYAVDNRNSGNQKKLGMGSAVLKPGPNKFCLKTFRQYRSDGQTVDNPAVPAGVVWTDSRFNFGYDPQGRESLRQEDYQRMEDPGDGSLFTFCLPEDDFVYPGHPDEVFHGVQPDFELMRFADGSGLDLEGCTNGFCASSLEGFPVLNNAALFAVTNRWKVGTDELGSKKLVTAGKLDFTGSKIVLDDTIGGKLRGSKVFCICEAEGGIVGAPSSVEGDDCCTTVISADGKSLCLRRTGPGFSVIIR